MATPAPPGSPPGLGFHPGTCACLVILEMLVLNYDSTVSQRDGAGYTCNHVYHSLFMLHNSHDLVIMNEYSCDQHVSSENKQESWFV